MYYLMLAVLCSVTVSILLKTCRQLQVELAQAVTVNYVVAFALNFFIYQPNFSTDWSQLSWGVFIALGVLLPSVFIIMGRAVEQVGIAKSDVAQRLSLILPIISAVVLFGEHLEAHKIVGIIIAFIALLCLLAKPDTEHSSGKRTGLVLLGVWLGYGVIDILLKQFSKSPALAVSLAVMFGIAFVLMLGYVTFLKQKWTWKSILGGVLLGIVNFFNIVFYIKAHKALSSDPTIVFTGMNIGVISFGALIGVLVFKETLRKINVVGLVLAVIAVLVLFNGGQVL